MEAEIEKTLVLKLTREEAVWLHWYMQNGLPEEDSQTARMREKFFTYTGGLE